MMQFQLYALMKNVKKSIEKMWMISWAENLQWL